MEKGVKVWDFWPDRNKYNMGYNTVIYGTVRVGLSMQNDTGARHSTKAYSTFYITIGNPEYRKIRIRRTN